MKQNKCDWCGRTDNQIKVGEDWNGYIIACVCGHEYIQPAKTKAGNKFWEFLEKEKKEFKKNPKKYMEGIEEGGENKEGEE